MRVAFLLLGLLGSGLLQADDHLVRESTRTYMGRTRPPQRSEVWITEGKVRLQFSRVVSILRHDLGVRWTILTEKNRYLEEPLRTTPQGVKAVRIQEAGFNYEPIYTWRVKDPGTQEVLEGRPCQRLRVEGEADFASESQELWVDRAPGLDMARFFRQVLALELPEDRLALFRGSEPLRTGLVIKSVTTTEPAIAPASVVTSRIIKVEQAEAPAGFYDLPAGCVKVATLEALHQ